VGRVTTGAVAASVVMLAACPGWAVAGANHAGRAYLSWDRAGSQSLLRAVPSEANPLYLHLAGAPDVVELAAVLRWTPCDSLGPRYVVVDASLDPFAPPDSLSGWATRSEAAREFAGDPDYDWP
jgi:hypothetical protein